MSERFCGQMEIGGELDRNKLEEFIECLNNEGFLESFDSEVVEANVLSIVDRGTTLKGGDPEATWGEFPEIEEFCRKNQLSYHRISSPYYEYSGELSWWVPGMAGPESVACTDNGEPYMTLLELKEAQEAKETLSDVITWLERVPKVPNLSWRIV